jgi:simple sugar transport system permease protein
MVFEAAVVIIICLLQSPAFRARVVALGRRGRPSPGLREPAEPAEPATVEVAS